MTGTGRCGTKTWARACSHLVSHTSGHESHGGRVNGYLDFPDDHIEVDPHLSWMLARLVTRYPDAVFVHLWREEEEVVASWKGRGIRRHRGAAPLVDVIYQVRSASLGPDAYDQALRELYRSVVARCDWILSRQRRFLSVNIHEAREAWPTFCDMVGAVGDLREASAELGRRA